jgi:hypothetical protein
MAKATLLVRHQVEDFATWRSAYDGAEGLRQEFGCTANEVLVSPADDHDVYVLHRFPSLEQAQGFASSDGLHEIMGRAGVKGAPRVEITVEA